MTSRISSRLKPLLQLFRILDLYVSLVNYEALINIFIEKYTRKINSCGILEILVSVYKEIIHQGTLNLKHLVEHSNLSNLFNQCSF